MLYVYLFATVAGVILLGVSLFGGGDDHDSGGHDSDGGTHGDSALGALGAVLSIRVWTYVLAFGGLTGLALRYLARVPEPFAALAAFASGAIAASMSRALIRRVITQSGTAPSKTSALVGRTAAVIVPFGVERTGKIRVQVDDRTVDLLATTDDASLDARDEVLIVEVDGSTAHVTRNPIAPAVVPPKR
jgi:membrane protein implicated in regulation of membrane protease activity